MTNALIAVPEGVGHDTYRDIISGATAAYSVLRRVPTISEIRAHCGRAEKTISRVVSTTEFRELMRLRGFPFDAGPALRPEQVFAVGIITDPTNRKPLRDKLKQAGITYAQYRGWLKQEHFRKYIETISEQMLGEHVADIHTKVVEKAGAGDIQAIRLYYELTGRHDPNKQQMVDLQGIIGLLLEVITRYVTDTTQLNKITKDIELIMSGKTPDALTHFDMSRVVDAEVVESTEEPKAIGSAFIEDNPFEDIE